MTEEEQKAHQEQERKEHHLHAYDNEIKDLVWATSLLIKCTAFYVALKGFQIFRTIY
jgi:hypothetical protein